MPSIRLVRERHQSLGNPFLLGICLRCRRPIAIAKWNKRIGFLELAVLLAGCCEGTHEISHCWIFDTIPEKHDVIVSEHLDDERSEEHTSELQSLMRISYAVFCL